MDRRCNHERIVWDHTTDTGFRVVKDCPRVGVLDTHEGLVCALHDPYRALARPGVFPAPRGPRDKSTFFLSTVYGGHAGRAVVVEDEGGIVAAGGWCAPSEIVYGFPRSGFRGGRIPRVGDRVIVGIDPASGRDVVVEAEWRGPDIKASWMDEAWEMFDKTKPRLDIEVRSRNGVVEVRAVGSESVGPWREPTLGELLELEARNKELTSGHVRADPDWLETTLKHNPHLKESTMSTADRLRSEAERLLDRAAKIEALPSEPKRGKYFALEVRYSGGTTPRVYSYGLVRVRSGKRSLWYSTATATAGGRSWSNLIPWDSVESATLTRLRKEK